MRSMNQFNHWRRANKIRVFVPHTAAEAKSGKQGKNTLCSTDCGSGCSGPGCGTSCGSSCR